VAIVSSYLPSSPLPLTERPRPRRCAAFVPEDATVDGVALWSPVIDVPGGVGELAGALRTAARQLLPLFGTAGCAVLVLEHDAAAGTIWLIDARWSDGVAELAHNGYVMSRVVLPAVPCTDVRVPSITPTRVLVVA
jgi:hypothetical protein